MALLAVAAVCAFGLLATLEPGAPDQVLLFRIVYGTGAALSLVGAGLVLTGRKGKR